MTPEEAIISRRRLTEIETFDYERDLYSFVEAAWPAVDSAAFVTGGYAIQAVCEHLQACCDGHIRNLLINIPPRFSKPVAADAIISTHRGLIPLRDVLVGDHVLTHRGRFRAVRAVHQQGTLPVLKITTRRGRSVLAAPDHPFLTPTGWRDLGAIQTDDVVGVIPQFEPSGTETISLSEAALLGYLVGDGSCQGTPNITVADDTEADDIRRVIVECGFQFLDQSYRMANTGYMLRRISLKADGPIKRGKTWRGPVRAWMETHDMWGKTSYTKFVPDAVMRGTDAIVKEFVGAYWACDGFITTKGVKRDGTERDDLMIGCDSVHREYLVQMQMLLLRLGIESTVRTKVAHIKTKRQGDTYTSYALTITDQDNCWRFANQITIPHSKNERLVNARKRRFDFDRVVVGNPVDAIEPSGEADCICLTVEEDASFVANGFAVHNSSVCGTMFPAWVWAQRESSSLSGPGAQFLHSSYSMNLSTQDSVKCRTLIQSDWYQARWGDRFKLVGDVNTKTRFQNDHNGARIAVSVGGTTTGLGGNYLIADDLNNAQFAHSEAMNEAATNWWDTAWYNRLNDPRTGCRIVISQRLSERDVSGHILERQVGGWTHLCLPMRYEADRSFHTVLVPAEATEDGNAITWIDPREVDGELLWPERFPEKEVFELETTLGPYGTAGQLQQRPVARGGEIIKREWWQLWPESSAEWPMMDFIVASLDTAYTTKQENDFSALTVWGVFTSDTIHQATRVMGADGIAAQVERVAAETSPKLMLMDAWAERLQLHDLVEKVAATCRKMKIDVLLIEDKAAGHSVAQEIRRLFGHENWGVQLINPGSADKVARVHSIVHLFADGMIYAPDRAWADKVITQCEAFPRGRNDDLVDTVSMGIRHLRGLGMLTMAPERRAEIEDGMRHQGGAPAALYPV